MNEKFPLLLVFLIFGVFGRELYGSLGSIPYIVLFLLFSRLETFKEVNVLIFVLLVVINIINVYFSIKYPSEGIYNISFITLSIFPFVFLKRSKKFHLTPYAVAILIIIIAVIKEYQLQQYGHSLHFSFESVRNIGNIRQSSDTIGVLSVIYLILRYNDKKFAISSKYVLVDIYVIWILLRYDIKTVILAYLLSIFYKPIVKYKYYLLCVVLGILGYILYYGYYLNFLKLFSESENIIWRLAIWADFLGHDFDLLQTLIGKYSKTIEWPITELLGFKGYINPHNSYILIIHYFGLIYLILYMIVLYKVFFRNGNSFNKQLFVFMFVMAFTTAVYELPYVVLTIAFFLRGNNEGPSVSHKTHSLSVKRSPAS